ncbi:hypothetical protein J2X20_002063 [Pelomonas saccharophila]|uniref:Uncharacterized protein n=1 Tax=Roseateles saccharophilus TaxID=304 RepID=A0ABU1YKQ5_ROSSA|nr:hypothetical protein [Roseateles saccharophilus]MDR7269434.1 hypothetical protein [Roseateles saccharophilus]
MNTLTPPARPAQPAPRSAISFARMLVLAQRRFRAQQRGAAAA